MLPVFMSAPNASFTSLANIITRYILLYATNLTEGFHSGSLPLYC